MAETLLGSKIGHFRFVDKIATGGMGEVYAGYDETLQRKVALKGIKREFELSEEAKGRFLREARVLSQLGHPNICQIYDYLEGDKSDFIVMELVEGRSLTQAMKKGLEGRIKMRIAEQVAAVLVAAHEKGVIHRDLKPDNVMLAEGDQVKVLDFGLSRRLDEEVTSGLQGEASLGPKATAGAAPEDDLTHGLAESSGSSPASGSLASLTTVGAIMGTLGYMSPEQARGEVATAASDLYSFGLVLQELFTGRPSYEPGLKAATRLEKAKKGETLPVSGVDSDLAALIGRLKSLEPAARPSAADAAEKLVWIRRKPKRRRLRLLVAAAITVLVIFGAAMTVQSVRATRAEKRALEEAETAKQVSGFLVDLFKVSDPSEARGKTVTAREILDKGSKKITTDLQDQPLVQARLMDTMGTVYIGLGLFKDAEPLIASALAIREKALPANHSDLAESLVSLAELDRQQGKYSDAESLFKRALAIQEKAHGPDNPEVAPRLNDLALTYFAQGKYSEAEPLYKRALAIQEKAHDPANFVMATILNNLALLYWNQGKYAEAEPLYKRSLAILEKALGPDHPNVATCLSNLADVLRDQGKYAEAEPLSERALAIHEKVLGPDHPDVATSLCNLASLCQNRSKYAQAEPLFKQALAIREKAFGSDHPYVATSLNYLTVLYSDQGKYAQAEPLCRRSLAIWEKGLGPDNPNVATGLGSLATIYRNQGEYAKAEPLLKRALAIMEKALGSDHRYVAATLTNLALLYCNQGKYAEAEPLFKRALAIREKAVGPRSRETAGSLRALASCEFKEERFNDALDRSVHCLEIGRELAAKTQKDERARFLIGSTLLLKGQIQAAMGKGAEGQSSWKEALSILEPIAKNSQRVSDQDTYAQTLLCLGRTEEARPIVKKLLDSGYKNPDLLTLCREKGLMVRESSERSKP